MSVFLTTLSLIFNYYHTDFQLHVLITMFSSHVSGILNIQWELSACPLPELFTYCFSPLILLIICMIIVRLCWINHSFIHSL